MMQRSALNLPNSITISRILAIPICVYVLFINGGNDTSWRIVAWCLFFIVGMTDLLDGKLARSRNTVTEFGKLLDPIADKALIGSALISLSLMGDLAWWVTIVILVRELGITLFRFAVLKNGVIPANRGGKIKTTVQNIAAGFYILPLGEPFYIFRDTFMGLALVLTIGTGIWYVRDSMIGKRK